MVREAESRILDRLEEQEALGGSLPPILQFYRKLLIIQREAARRAAAPVTPLTREAIAERLGTGTPLLGFDALDLDWPLFTDTFQKVASLFAEYPGLFLRMPPNLAENAAGFLTREKVRACYEGPGPTLVPGTGEDGNVTQDIIMLALGPFLRLHSENLIGFVDQERWRRPCCPVCGGRSDFACLDRESGLRRLLCSRCNAEWLFQRLECPHCGCTDQTKLAFFSDDESLYRLYVCEECRRYLKAIDLRVSRGEVLLPLERFLTLDMDAQAREYGYIT